MWLCKTANLWFKIDCLIYHKGGYVWCFNQLFCNILFQVCRALTKVNEVIVNSSVENVKTSSQSSVWNTNEDGGNSIINLWKQATPASNLQLPRFSRRPKTELLVPLKAFRVPRRTTVAAFILHHSVACILHTPHTNQPCLVLPALQLCVGRLTADFGWNPKLHHWPHKKPTSTNVDKIALSKYAVVRRLHVEVKVSATRVLDNEASNRLAAAVTDFVNSQTSFLDSVAGL